ncbi:MAG: glycosyltransferase family 2 protein [Proteobacteria bacterium]|nr:glycosyltransferase family 2 protein [Pseudomonadota bacterium]
MASDPLAAKDKVLVFVPTLNDVEHLATIIDEINELNGAFTVLVLDDGSTAPVKSILKGSHCLHFRLPANFGLGVCTHIAFDHALRGNYRAIVRVDSDGQHPVEMIPALLAKLTAGEADVVVASRSNRNQGSGWRFAIARIVRGYISATARLLTKGVVPSDVNSGFFAANPRAMAVLNTYSLERFPEPQMYILACRHSLRVAEVPVDQMARKHGASTITFGHALRIVYRFNIFVLSELLQWHRT